MSFQEFNGTGIKQQDTVGSTLAEVDVCQTICAFNVGGILGNNTFEVFTETQANAVFINFGTADILLDHYTVTIENSGIPARTVRTAQVLTGGRCSNAPTKHCGLDRDCGLGLCNQTDTSVQVLLVDFTAKELVVGDAICPGVDPNTGMPTPGTVVPLTKQIRVTFTGSDETGKRFTVDTGLVGSFFDANNCVTGR